MSPQPRSKRGKTPRQNRFAGKQVMTQTTMKFKDKKRLYTETAYLLYNLHLHSLSTTKIPPRCRRRAGPLVVPAQVCMVAQFPWLDQMRSREKDAEDDADPAYDDVGDAKEGVLAADYGGGGDDDGFCAAVLSYVEVWGC
jgi:hypothetical protein